MLRHSASYRAERSLFGSIAIAWILALATPIGLATAADLTVTVVDKDGNPVSDAVVFLIGGPPTEPGPTVKMVQRNQSFNPDVLAVSVGTSIEFPNEDPFRHHVYSFSPAKRFELKLYGGDEVQEVTFEQAGEIALGCNIHDDMLGYIYVVDTNLFSTTDENGAAAIAGLEDGSSYEAQVWHPRLRGPTRRTAQSVTNTQNATIEIGLKRDRRKQSGSDFEEGVY
ncbi:MAG: methylamine utilization protein [Alphaproteobacteria bacterium]|nr:methylamine utilization protein [Alphaproteobacteria bacterium]